MADLINLYTVADARKALCDIQNEMVDLVVTDPPYGIGYTRTHGLRQKKPVLAGDTPAEAVWLLRAVVKELERVMKPGAAIYLFCPGGKTMFRQGAELIRVLETAFELRGTLVWDKMSIGPGVYWRNQFESIVMASKGRVGNWQGGRAKANILRHKRVRALPSGHPTPKPLPLVKELLECSSRLGDLVLDPFAGSGVVGAGAQELGRRWICLDIDRRWAKEAKERYGLPVKGL